MYRFHSTTRRAFIDLSQPFLGFTGNGSRAAGWRNDAGETTDVEGFRSWLSISGNRDP